MGKRTKKDMGILVDYVNVDSYKQWTCERENGSKCYTIRRAGKVFLDRLSYGEAYAALQASIQFLNWTDRFYTHNSRVEKHKKEVEKLREEVNQAPRALTLGSIKRNFPTMRELQGKLCQHPVWMEDHERLISSWSQMLINAADAGLVPAMPPVDTNILMNSKDAGSVTGVLKRYLSAIQFLLIQQIERNISVAYPIKEYNTEETKRLCESV